jgi:hypothetical protein
VSGAGELLSGSPVGDDGERPARASWTTPYDGHEHAWYWPTSLPCPRHCYRCGIVHPDETFRPVLPPVVPDSEPQPVSWPYVEKKGLTVQPLDLHGPVASGVVPDKPALAYDESCDDASCDCCETWRVLLADIRREANAPVPAVTDDEAAANGYVVVPRHLLEELREATETIGVYWPGKPGYAVVKAAAAVVEAVGPTREDH